MGNIHPSVYIADGARLVGDVELAKDCSVWYNAVIRADDNPIKIGERTNIQDNCVLHVSSWSGLTIGRDVTIGHGAIVHGCTVGDNTLIGMGAIVMNDAKVGNNCIIAAGAIVTERTVIPDGYLALGTPARVVRPLTQEDTDRINKSAIDYSNHAKSLLNS